MERLKKMLVMLTAILLGITNLKAQELIIAAKTDALVLEQIAQTAEQILTMQDSYEKNKSLAEKLTNVNKYVKDAKVVDKIVKEQGKVIKSSKEFLKHVKKVEDSRDLVKSSGVMIEKNLRAVSKAVELASYVCSSGYFSMSDKDRLKILDNQLIKISEIRTQIDSNLETLKLIVSN